MLTMIRKLALLALMGSLAACGGSGVGPNTNSNAATDGTDTSGTDTGGTDTNTGTDTGVTYYSLAILHGSKDFSGFPEDNLFQGDSVFPYIEHYMLHPINSTSLSTVTNATVDHFKIMENEAELDANEAFPLLQKVEGNRVQLRTAIVVDISDSMNAVSRSKMVSALKAFVDSAKKSSDYRISNQLVTVWAFGQGVKQLTSGFTELSALDTALNEIPGEDLGGFSNLYRAIAEAIGGYDETTPSEIELDFRDDLVFEQGKSFYELATVDGSPVNDLYDRVTADGINLSTVVVISSGSDTSGDFDKELYQKAIEWQSLVVFDTDAEAVQNDDANPDDDSASNDDSDATLAETTLLPRPVIYIYPSEGTTDETVLAHAEKSIPFSVSSTSYNWDEAIIDAQIAALDARIKDSYQYLLRFASPKRQGKHTQAIESKSAQNKYKLSSKIERNDIGTGTPLELSINDPTNYSIVEITTKSNAYLSAKTASKSLQPFYPATRWTTETYDSANYKWELDGVTLPTESDGSVSISTAGTLKLTNTVLNQSYTLIVTD